MAEEKNELLEVAVIKPFPSFVGKRTSTDKRCFNGRLPDEPTDKVKKDGTPVMKKGKTIPTQHKVRFDLPIPSTDEEAKQMCGVTIQDLVAAGMIQSFYSANKVDAYLETIGTGEIDVAGLTALAEQDMPKQERVRKISEVKEKAGKYDALKAKFGLSDEELEQAIALAKKKNLLGKK